MIACFHGMMGYRPFVKQLDPGTARPVLGEQPIYIGQTRIFVVPNPSPANAHASLESQIAWYDRLVEAVRIFRSDLASIQW